MSSTSTCQRPRRHTALAYVPDPSSQTVSTIGGNVAENAGGPHCLLYGMTSNHVLGLEVVLADGAIVQLGGVAPDAPGLDLRGVMVGSEGTLGIVTKVIVGLIPRPADARTLLAIFDLLEDAGRAVSAIIAHGIIPAALEIMDGRMMRAVEAAVHAGYPPDAEAVLLVEIDGYAEGLDDLSGADRRHLPPERRTRDSPGDNSRRARRPVEGSQVGLRSHGAHRTHLLHPGRRCAAFAAARGAALRG